MNNKLASLIFFVIAMFSGRAMAQAAISFTQCPFTGPAQTWSSSGEADITSSSEISGAVEGQYLGFNKVSTKSHSCGKHTKCLSNTQYKQDYPGKDLLVSQPSFVSFQVNSNEKKFESSGSLTPDSYKKVEVLKKATVTLSAGEYWIDEFAIKENSEINITGPVVLNVNKLTLDDKASINHTGAPAELLIIGHINDGTIELKSKKKDHEFNAYIAAYKDVLISEKTKIKGAVIAYKLKLDKQGMLTSDLSGCDSVEPPPELDHCELFPGPVQTWEGNTNNLITTDSTNLITKTNNYQIGFSNQIITSYPSDYHPPSTPALGKCDGQACQLNGTFAKKKTLSWSSSGASQSLQNTVITDTQTASPGTYYYAGLGWTYGLTVEPTGNLTLPSGEYWVDAADIRGGLTIDGQVTLHVKDELNIGGAVNTLNPADNLTIFAYNSGEACPLPGNYPSGPPQVNVDYAVNINVSGEFNGRIYSQGPVALSNATTVIGAVTACQLQMSNTAKVVGDSQCFDPVPQEYLLELVPDDDLQLVCERQSVEFQVKDKSTQSLITDYSGQVTITAPDAFPSGQAFWYLSETGGENTKRDIMGNNTSFAVSGGKVKLWLKSDFVGSIGVTGNLSTDTADPKTGNFQFVPFKLEIQQGELKSVANKPQDISIVAKACADDKNDDSIANGYTGVRTLKFGTEYTAPTALQGAGAASLLLKDKDGKWQASEGKFEFKVEINADNTETVRARTALKYADAGRTKLILYDPNCTRTKCDIDTISRLMAAEQTSLSSWERLEGVQSVATRPFTFALCNDGTAKSIQDATGTSEQGNAFVAAGEAFGLKVKPVVWMESDGNSTIDTSQNAIAAVDSSGMCGRVITPSFYSENAPVASVVLSIPSGDGIRPHSPDKDGAIPGSLTSSSLSNVQIKDSAFSASWSEVGSIWLQADTQAKYLDMDINMGQRPVGRFYPDHFSVVVNPGGSEGILPANGSFSYMEQPFTGKFTVKAMNTSAPVGNYHLFASSLQADFGLWLGSLVSGQYESLDLARLHVCNTQQCQADLAWQSWGNVASQGSVSPQSGRVFDATGSDKPRMTIARLTDTGFTCPLDDPNSCAHATKADGPYQALDFRVNVSKFADGVDFVLTATEKNQNAVGAYVDRTDIRYGRMVLEDVGGRADSKIAIPLRAEYWDGNDFETNTDDSLSTFDGDNYCKQIIAQSDSTVTDSTSQTSGQGSVTAGEISSGEFVAQPHSKTNYREQVQFWQRLTSATPAKLKASDCTGSHSNQPWLQYNWRQFGDESPSAVVTFGVYRGNDRIIYRGEKGMNQLLN
ncbi:polymer-forming cytoskeletal protein [Photobacterium sp. OFAV2-7]|uniref:polymer-forming cytoskeletal protein n=1 Tax=Photobacterium sp. OFAV2-7 TaxID=2917748 RepID=UPI001EF580F9|nr:polymer-forming cytoskeletal protein [Photobacterium sp. OFAV2-7]MCG7584287.1 polymer-forming cytoskeletal protein [Photobacterium sp. OFAV2-7]